MLTTIRSKASGVISYILIGLICLTFALWGINSYFEGGTQVDVASVNGSEIGYQNYQNQLRSRQQQLRTQFQNSLPEEYFESPGFKRQIIDQMVDEVLLDQTIQSRRYSLDDEQLSDYITSDPTFHTDGKFDNDRYLRLLATNNLTVDGFEQRSRQQGSYVQVQRALSDSFYVDDNELNEILMLKHQKRHADYVVVNSNQFEPEVSEDEVKKQYEDFADLYQTEEKLKLDYVELSAQTLIDPEPLADEDVQTYYEENKAGFSKPAVRKVSHILIKPESDSPESEQMALESAQKLLEEINAGADFSQLAKEHSADKGSANNGGDLGVITPGIMVKPFEDAVFALTKQDEVSEPVKSDFGYHIIKMTEFTPEDIQPLEEIKDQIVEKIKTDRAIEQFVEQAETFKNLAFENPQDLTPIADQLGLEVKNTDWFTRSSANQGIVANQAVLQAAFNPQIIDEGINSDVIESGENQLVVIRKNDYQGTETKPLDDVSEQIKILLKANKSQEMAVSKGEELLKNLQENPASWQELTSADELTVMTLPLTRSEAGAGVEQLLSSVIFQKPKPAADKPVIDGLTVADGYSVFRLTQIEDVAKAELEALAEQEREALMANFKRRFGDETTASLLDSIRSQAEIQVFEENL